MDKRGAFDYRFFLIQRRLAGWWLGNDLLYKDGNTFTLRMMIHWRVDGANTASSVSLTGAGIQQRGGDLYQFPQEEPGDRANIHQPYRAEAYPQPFWTECRNSRLRYPETG